jgi:hypothetical protein
MENKSAIPSGAFQQSFQLFEQFAEAAVGWNIGFRQLFSRCTLEHAFRDNFDLSPAAYRTNTPC